MKINREATFSILTDHSMFTFTREFPPSARSTQLSSSPTPTPPQSERDNSTFESSLSLYNVWPRAHGKKY